LPTKPSDDEDTLPVLTDYRKRSVSPDSQDAEDKLEELRKKFVGEIDLPESQWLYFMCELIFNLAFHFRRRAFAQRIQAPFRSFPHSIPQGLLKPSASTASKS
jgi:hypothetical protein